MLYERVTGPLRGYHVAVYACEVGEFGQEYVGYYKICSEPPPSYFEADCLLKGCCETQRPSAVEALDAAENLARMQIGNMPPLADLAAYREQRPLYWYEREVLEGPLGSA
jgi:hypothetical protein